VDIEIITISETYHISATYLMLPSTLLSPSALQTQAFPELIHQKLQRRDLVLVHLPFYPSSEAKGYQDGICSPAQLPLVIEKQHYIDLVQLAIAHFANDQNVIMMALLSWEAQSPQLSFADAMQDHSHHVTPMNLNEFQFPIAR
jgi:hypothetical protein